MASSRMAELASIISDCTQKCESKLAELGLPLPTFSPEMTSQLHTHPEIALLRHKILDATDELHALMLGPVGLLTTPAHNFMISLQAIYRFKLASCVSYDENGTSFEEVADKSGLPLSLTRRLLRHSMTYHIFCERTKGFVAHTAASRMLVESNLMHQWVGMVSEEMWPSATKTVDAIATWPGSEEPNQCGFNAAFNTSCGVFDIFSQHPVRQKRYADAMAWFSHGPGFETSHVVTNYDWESIAQKEGVVVDIGGSYGAVAIEIAHHFPTIKCIVQDRPDVAANGEKRLPEGITNVSFMAHDFFTEQCVRGADVYLLRWILHDWSDEYATRILRSLIPALKPGAKVLVNEYVVPEPGAVSAYVDRMYRGYDLAMLELHNGRERDAEEWAQLFQAADHRFQNIEIKVPPMSRLGLIEATWRGL